jgi:cell division protein FtsQ
VTGRPSEPSRFARRQWRRRLRAARPWLVGLAVVGLVGLAGYAVLFSPWLTADEVEVSGESRLSADDVAGAAGVDLSEPLARVDLDAVAERVETLPAVESAQAHRSWPHTITIEVTERTPLVAVRQDGDWWVMDAHGVVFAKTPERDRDLPVVELAPDADQAARRETASVVAALPAAMLRDVKQVTARTMDSITLSLDDKTQVRWGSADQTDRKVEVLAVLLDQVKASTYDVSVPEQPTTQE